MISTKKIITIVLLAVMVMAAVAWLLLSKFSMGGINISPSNLANDVNQSDNNIKEKLLFLNGLSDDEKTFLQKAENYDNLLKLQKICNRQEDGPAQEECWADLALNQVLILKRADLCGQLQSKKDDCYIALAEINNDAKLCASVQDQDRKIICENNILLKSGSPAKNLAECAARSDMAKVSCVLNFIGQQTEISVCDDPVVVSLSEQSTDICKGRILSAQAVATNDKTLCEQIKMDDIKLSCQRFFQTPPKF